jgi:hypothetical protein
MLSGGARRGAKPRSTNTSERAYVITHSQAIDGVCYDSARSELTIFFRSGTAYVYREVQEPVFRAFHPRRQPGPLLPRAGARQVHLAPHDRTGTGHAMVDRHDGRTGW